MDTEMTFDIGDVNTGDDQFEPELTAQEYARICGLCTDYMTESPTDFYITVTRPETSTQDLKDPEGAKIIEISTDDLIKERLEVDAEARELLFSVMKDDEDAVAYAIPGIESRSAALKLELPLLQTDHELDVLHFGHRAVPDFENMNLPMEHSDPERDEGMEWPTKYLDLPQRMDRKYEAERLEVPRKGAHFLMGVVRDTWDSADEEELYAKSNYTKNKALEPLTPPLLTLSPPLTPFEPSLDAAELELLSESTNPIAAESDIVNAQLFRRDRILPSSAGSSDVVSFSNTDDLLNIYSPLRSVINSSTPSPPRKRKVNDLKVEAPLTPLKASSPLSVKKIKRVTFPEMLHEYVLDSPIVFQPSQPVRDSDASLDTFFNEVVEPMALIATQRLEQEQLQEADSVYRVNIPIVDFTSHLPPWKIYGRRANGKDPAGLTELDLQRRLLQEMKRNDLKQYPPWTGISNIERQLPWSPFPPELGKVTFDESINDGRYLQTIMDFMSLEDVVISDSLAWKPDGLRILDELDESEDELEELDLEEPDTKDMDVLRKKIQGQLDEERLIEKQQPVQKSSEVPVRSHDSPAQQLASYTKRTTTDLDSTISGGKIKDKSSVTGLFGSNFSVAAALSTFMQNMGQVSKRPKISEVVLTHPPPVTTANVLGNPKTTIPEAPSLPTPPLPFPALPVNPPSAFFTLSSTLLQSQRHLVRAIQRLYSTANFIERDFTSIPTAAEADIILSPAAGLVLTTLQKIKQRALPGQEQRLCGVRERLTDLIVRYERIIVLVGEGAAATNDGSTAMRVLDEHDCDAIAEFSGFASSLEADVQTMFVPGGEEDLVKWVVGCMIQYSIQTFKGQEVILLQDETLWEQYLRRLGLNAFAAQLILAELKETDTDVSMQDTSSSDPQAGSSALQKEFGLRAFVRMDPKERIRRFEGIFGGRRVLWRVNKALGQHWMSAVNGFQNPADM